MVTSERVSELERRIAEGTLARGRWTGTDARGRQTACLLAALAPECGVSGSAGSCPAEVMPAWLAHLTPWLDDAPSAEAWPGLVRRYSSTPSTARSARRRQRDDGRDGTR